MSDPYANDGSGLETDAVPKLLVLSTLVIDRNEDDILKIGLDILPEIGDFKSAKVFLLEAKKWVPSPASAVSGPFLESLIGVTSPSEIVTDDPCSFTYVIPLLCRRSHIGHLVIESGSSLDDSGFAPIQLWCLQIAAAIENAWRHERLVRNAEELSHTVRQLEDILNMQERLTQVAVQGGGIEGIAAAVFELTQRPVAVEDVSGQKIVQLGDWPDGMPRRQGQTEQQIQSLARQQTPTWVGSELIGLVHYRSDSHALLRIYDPGHHAGDYEIHVLQYAATVLAMGLARSAIVAETELRLKRDLVEGLLLGLDEASAKARAEALEIDVRTVRRVAVIRPNDSVPMTAGDRVLHMLRRTLATYGNSDSLMVTRGPDIVCLAEAHTDWNSILKRINSELRAGAKYRVGVGDLCATVADYPRSLRHAQQALTLTAESSKTEVILFDDLGVYKLFASTADTSDLRDFIAKWLQPIIDYDDSHSSDLIKTLTSYLRSGGSLRNTSEELMIHRSTVKYRLERVKSLTNYDLNEPATRFSVQLAAYALETQRKLKIERT